MSTVWVKEFTGGLDTRRMPETSSGAVLMKAENGHINRGGEFEKRAAFVPEYTLPAGTTGCVAGLNGLYVFGHTTAPAGIPAGITYQRLQHSDGVTALSRILSVDLYAGKLYVAAEFADGAIFHYYDGTRVPDWFDGRARASFDVTGGSSTAAVAAAGSFTITGGSLGTGNQITSVTVAGVEILGVPVAHTGNNSTTAAAVAAQINSFASSPEYTAAASGATVTITAATAGAAANGRLVVPTPGGDATVGSITNMAAGADAVTSKLSDLKVNGVSIINAPVSWTTSNEATAAAIASAINSFTSTPDYTATSVGTRVNIVAATAGAAANGRAVAFTLASGLAVSPATGLALANGADSSTTSFQPGSSVKTIGSKMYALSGSVLHFSGVDQPTEWTTDTTGAGFVDMSKEDSGAQQLVALARYQQFAAMFAARVILIWYFDPDESLNRSVQTLSNTGTVSGKSVTQFGDNDVFYVDESGQRSLRARDSSNAAATTDIGVPIDTLVTAKLRSLSDEERQNIIGLIEPRDGRYWLIMKDTIFVFSFFNGSKISAWSSYTPSTEIGGVQVPFSVDDAVVFNRRVHLRSGNTIYVYGGTGETDAYDGAVAEAWLPFLDANDPTRPKNWDAIDAALEGEWEVRYALEPKTPDYDDPVAILFATSYNEPRKPSGGESTHISPRFRTKGSGPARLSAVVVHFTSSSDED